MIKGIVKGRALSIFGIDGDRLTAGSVGLKIQFTFDDEWSGLSKTVVFQNGSILRSATVQDDECTVPFEVMVNPGSKLRIGIRGVDGSSTVIPTIYADILIYQGTVEASSPGGQYTPSDIEQIQGEIGDLSELQTSVKTSLVGAINSLSGQALSEELKLALLQLASKVAYIDEDGQDYYDDLYNALYRAAELVSISAVFTQGQAVIYDTDSLDTLKQYLVVTATYSDSSTAVVPSANYTLSGTLTEGTSTITAAYEGKTDTFSVIVTHLDLEYVTDGLICRFDGIDNTGVGHNSNSGIWKDLVGSLDLTITGGTWDDDGLVFNQSNSQQAIASSNISVSTDMTIEMVFIPTATVTQMVGSFCNMTSLACRFAIYSDNTVGFRGESGKSYLNSESALTDIKTMAAIYSNSSIVKGLVNNTLLSRSNNTHSFSRAAGRPLILANVDSSDTNKYPFKGKIMAVRIYNRALTDSELNKNHQVDIMRFNLGA